MATLESKAKIKLNEMKKQKIFDQAKKDFADYISTLFKSGRFAHVSLAADFYRKVFEEGEYPRPWPSRSMPPWNSIAM